MGVNLTVVFVMTYNHLHRCNCFFFQLTIHDQVTFYANNLRNICKQTLQMVHGTFFRDALVPKQLQFEQLFRYSLCFLYNSLLIPVITDLCLLQTRIRKIKQCDVYLHRTFLCILNKYHTEVNTTYSLLSRVTSYSLEYIQCCYTGLI